ncbi:UDP-2,3-diacylglucosamine diphosphatase [Coprobacter tertius]|uniref:UDP-2,3-diacylglucosamine diphosphatase n=1 Tax=Coprobacter tertius TaxID=2944915 RepID=A0ABT1MJU9_9BACT|nr:UDP-2,3-diacylglucosamine diphosphatase [Coprobacter tertius]MCP9612644.1 UDP-2,3-diacylglucosamine diphosphatase [Coprobacter tertius]
MLRKKVSTVILSDVHIGSEHAKVKELIAFLKNIDCDKLILNGDILDGWKLQRNPFGKWKREYTELIKVIMKMMENHDTKVIYVRGNHDSFLDRMLPLSFASVTLVSDYVHVSHGRRYYVTHGDIFDNICSRMIWLAKLGDYGYSFLLWVNKVLNNYRKRNGKPYYSFSQNIKHKVKTAVSYISDFEKELTGIARSRHFDGVICGHIHQPADTWYDNIHYLNSGDWVESLSALIEHEDGTWEIYRYEDCLLMNATGEIFPVAS